MKPRLIMTWGDSIYGIDPGTGKSVSDWPQQGFNIMLPRTQGMVQGDNLGRGRPIPGAGGASSAGIAAGNGGGARPSGGGGDSGGGGEADKAAPVIYKNLIILGNATGFLPPPGRPADVRALDLHPATGLAKSPVLDPGQPGADSLGRSRPGIGQQLLGFPVTG